MTSPIRFLRSKRKCRQTQVETFLICIKSATRKKIEETKAAKEPKEPNNQTLISDFWLRIDRSLLNGQTRNM